MKLLLNRNTIHINDFTVASPQAIQYIHKLDVHL